MDSGREGSYGFKGYEFNMYLYMGFNASGLQGGFTVEGFWVEVSGSGLIFVYINSCEGFWFEGFCGLSSNALG